MEYTLYGIPTNTCMEYTSTREYTHMECTHNMEYTGMHTFILNTYTCTLKDMKYD